MLMAVRLCPDLDLPTMDTKEGLVRCRNTATRGWRTDRILSQGIKKQNKTKQQKKEETERRGGGGRGAGGWMG